jgi:hypothetical protein
MPKQEDKPPKKSPPKAKVEPASAKKAPGVIDTIVAVLQAGGGTAAEIAERVAKKFPNRKPEGIFATTKIQVIRLSKPKDEGGRALRIKREETEASRELIYSA